MYVIVAEQDENCRSLIVAVLKAIDVKVIHETTSVQGALHALRTRSYDALIADQKLAGGSGLDLVVAVRRSANQRLRRLPTMLLADQATRDLVLSAKMAGVDQFCVKPFAAQALARKASALLLKRFDGDREFTRLMADKAVRAAA